MNWISIYFVFIHSRWRTTYQSILSIGSPRFFQITIIMTKKHIQFLSGFQPVRYNCGINSCICFVGPYEDLTKCPNCQEARYTAKGKPQKSFNYLPLIPRLRAMLTNSSLTKKKCYRTDYVHEPTIIKDVFDSNHYQSLLNTIVPADKDHPFSISQMNTTLPSVFRQMDLLHSSSVTRRAGL